MPKVSVRRDRCKGCGLCAEVCPKGHLAIGTSYNKQGYAYIKPVKDTGCTGCAFCAEICPDMALKVYKEKKKHG